MTISEARAILARPKFGDPQTLEAIRVTERLEEAKKLIRRAYGRGGVIRRATPGGGLACKLMPFPKDMVETAYVELNAQP